MKNLLVIGRGGLVIGRVPRKLDVQALRATGVADILQLVAKSIELLHSQLEGLLDFVLGEDAVVEAVLLLVPEAVQHRGVGVAVCAIDQVGVVEHDVLVVETLAANVLHGGGSLIEDLGLVLATGCREARLELSLLLSLALLALSVVLGLSLAELLSRNHCGVSDVVGKVCPD